MIILLVLYFYNQLRKRSGTFFHSDIFGPHTASTSSTAWLSSRVAWPPAEVFLLVADRKISI